MRYFFALSLITLFSCSSMKKQTVAGKTSGNTTLAGTSWTISSIPGFQAEKTQKPVTLVFEDTSGRFGGSSGCNHYGGTYSLDGQSIKMSKVISTMMACSVGMKTERQLLDALERVDKYRVDGDKLVLMNGETVLLEFSRGKKLKNNFVIN